jgi:hypothetical protein
MGKTLANAIAPAPKALDNDLSFIVFHAFSVVDFITIVGNSTKIVCDREYRLAAIAIAIAETVVGLTQIDPQNPFLRGLLELLP